MSPARPKQTPRKPSPGQARRRVVMLAMPDANLVDVTGPIEVFANANRRLDHAGASAPRYQIELVAARKGPVRTSAGLELVAARALRDVRGPIDTLLVPGGDGVRQAIEDPKLVRWVAGAAKRSRRVASVCTGALLLAESGLLDGRRATTHWSACDWLARNHPQVEVDPDPIFVKDGNVYTSAGVTSGMDLALALVEEDLGRDVALTVARWMVLFLKRPGGQSQFSAQLRSQLAETEPIRDVQAFIAARPSADLSVASLARRAGMSARNFARLFTREVGTTPARFVESARVEAARRRLEETSGGVDRIADDVGFGNAEAMRRAFLRQVRVNPSDYRSRFQHPGSH